MTDNSFPPELDDFRSNDAFGKPRSRRNPHRRVATKSASRRMGAVIPAVCFLPAGWRSADAGQRSAIAPNAAVYRNVGTCPSLEFRKFFDVFVGDASVQRYFTRLPIIFGKTDMLSPGDPFERRKIKAYEAIPTFNSKDGGRIFPSKEAQRAIRCCDERRDGRGFRAAGR